MLNTFETINIISSLFFIANFLPIAFPPTVKDEIIELNINIVITDDKLNLTERISPIIADNEPLTIPQISPITSLHIDEILLPFFIK